MSRSMYVRWKHDTTETVGYLPEQKLVNGTLAESVLHVCRCTTTQTSWGIPARRTCRFPRNMQMPMGMGERWPRTPSCRRPSCGQCPCLVFWPHGWCLWVCGSSACRWGYGIPLVELRKFKILHAIFIIFYSFLCIFLRNLTTII